MAGTVTLAQYKSPVQDGQSCPQGTDIPACVSCRSNGSGVSVQRAASMQSLHLGDTYSSSLEQMPLGLAAIWGWK